MSFKGSVKGLLVWLRLYTGYSLGLVCLRIPASGDRDQGFRALGFFHFGFI